MQKLTELAEINKTFLIIYGQGGVGKTTFALNGQLGKVLVIIPENDGGAYAINNLSDEIKDNVDAMVLESGKSPISALVKAFIANADNYDTIIIDPFTNIRNEQALFLRKQDGKSLTSQKHWGQVKEQFSEMMKVLIKYRTQKNIIIVAHEEVRSVQDDITGVTSTAIQPALGTLNTMLGQYADEIFRLTLNSNAEGKIERKFDFGSDIVFGKTRRFKERHKINMNINDIIGNTIRVTEDVVKQNDITVDEIVENTKKIEEEIKNATK